MTTPRAHERTIHGIDGWRRALLRPLAWLVQAWSRTLALEVDAVSLALLTDTTRPVAFTLWHNRLFITAEVYRRFRRGQKLYSLVSASKDGAWLAAFFETCGMHTVRGSSSRFGREALHALTERIRAGHDIGITPDGPRGPCYDLKGGALLLARRTGADTVLLGARFEKAWRLPSWDRFYLPVPFSRVQLRLERVCPAALHGEDAAQRVRARLLALNPDASGLRPKPGPTPVV